MQHFFEIFENISTKIPSSEAQKSRRSYFYKPGSILQVEFDDWKTIPIGLSKKYFLENQKKFKEIDHYGEKYNIEKDTIQSTPLRVDIKDPEKVIASSWRSILVLGSKKLYFSLKPGVSYNAELIDKAGNTVEIPILAPYKNGVILLSSDLGDRVTHFVKVNFKADNFSNLNLSKEELAAKMELPLLLLNELDAADTKEVPPGTVVTFKSIINGNVSTARVVKRLALGTYLLDKKVNMSLLVPSLFIHRDILESNNVKKVVVSPCRLAYSDGKIVGAVNCKRNSIKKFVKRIVYINSAPIFYKI